MDAIHNERVKLIATALNNTAIATVVTGLIAPAANILYGLATLRTPYWWLVAASWLCGGLALHLGARWALGGLRP